MIWICAVLFAVAATVAWFKFIRWYLIGREIKRGVNVPPPSPQMEKIIDDCVSNASIDYSSPGIIEASTGGITLGAQAEEFVSGKCVPAVDARAYFEEKKSPKKRVSRKDAVPYIHEILSAVPMTLDEIIESVNMKFDSEVKKSTVRQWLMSDKGFRFKKRKWRKK